MGNMHTSLIRETTTTVKVLDTATNTVADEIPMDLSIDIAITPDGRHARVTNFDGVSVIATATNTVEANIQMDKGVSSSTGRGIAITPRGGIAYLTNGGLGTVSAIDTVANAVAATVGVGIDPVGVAVSPDGERAYVTRY
jgi:YVTN family beta-propeller protein